MPGCTIVLYRYILWDCGYIMYTTGYSLCILAERLFVHVCRPLGDPWILYCMHTQVLAIDAYI